MDSAAEYIGIDMVFEKQWIDNDFLLNNDDKILIVNTHVWQHAIKYVISGWFLF